MNAVRTRSTCTPPMSTRSLESTPGANACCGPILPRLREDRPYSVIRPAKSHPGSPGKSYPTKTPATPLVGAGVPSTRVGQHRSGRLRRLRQRLCRVQTLYGGPSGVERVGGSGHRPGGTDASGVSSRGRVPTVGAPCPTRSASGKPRLQAVLARAGGIPAVPCSDPRIRQG